MSDDELPQGILASTLSFDLTCANYYRLGVVARAGERGSRARNACVYSCCVALQPQHAVHVASKTCSLKLKQVVVAFCHWAVTCFELVCVMQTPIGIPSRCRRVQIEVLTGPDSGLLAYS